MKREFSIYLDLLRVLAALAVFLGHLSWARLSGGFLWRLQPYAHDGVIVFFVLSGFVIQHVATTKEKTFRDYQIARLARLYSVVLPALLLTWACDAIGTAHAPDTYLMARETQPWLRLGAAAVFLSQSWGWNLSMLSNDAFWSLPYEFWYYQLFGGALFLRGKLRMGWVLGCALIAGPQILLYLPIWLMGVGAAYASGRRPLRKGPAWALFIATALATALGMVLMDGLAMVHRSASPRLPPGFSVADFVLGALIALNLYAASQVQLPLLGVGKPIVFVAGFTFALYLFHLPLLHLAAAFTPGHWSPTTRGLCLAAFTLGAVFLLGLVTERRKGQVKAFVAQLFDAAGSAVRLPAK